MARHGEQNPAPFPKPSFLGGGEEAYKDYMKNKYDYEAWENSVILLGRKLRREHNEHKRVEEESGPETASLGLVKSSKIEKTEVTLTMDDFVESKKAHVKELSSEGNKILHTLVELLEDGLITREDFETRKKEIYRLHS